MSYLAPTDFTGRYAIAVPYNGDAGKLQTYIDFYENKYLVQLLGAELFDLFTEGYEADEEIYVKIFDPFNFDSETLQKPLISAGVLEMLKAFIFAHYSNGDLDTNTSIGGVQIATEAGKKVVDDSTLYRSYNDGVSTYKTIRVYILENLTDYPTFKGIYQGLIWSI